MPRILKNPEAEADLDEIWLFIARDDPAQADRFLDRIEEQCQIIARNSGIGTLCEELAPSLRRFTLGAYLIFYLEIKGGIQLVRILQGSRNIATLF